MRLSADEIAVIRSAVHARFGTDAAIWLFGSALDDSARGGDIDLYVEPGPARPDTDAGATDGDTAAEPANLFLAQDAVRRAIERQIRRPVDLVVCRERPTAFMRQARAEGRRL